MKFIILLLIIILSGCLKNDFSKKVIHTDEAPAAIGPYSQAIQTGNTIYLSGQIALVPETGKMIEGGIEQQTRQVMKNIESVLNTANCGFENVVQVQIFLTDLENYGTVNKIYAEYFDQTPPARAVIEVSRLPKDDLIEIMMTAVRDN